MVGLHFYNILSSLSPFEKLDSCKVKTPLQTWNYIIYFYKVLPSFYNNVLQFYNLFSFI